LPEADVAKKVAEKLDRFAANVPRNPELLTDVQKWHKFSANPDAAIHAVKPERRGMFLDEMTRLGQKYKGQAGGQDDGKR